MLKIEQNIFTAAPFIKQCISRNSLCLQFCRFTHVMWYILYNMAAYIQQNIYVEGASGLMMCHRVYSHM